MKQSWVPHDRRDEVVDFVRHWSEKSEIVCLRLVQWIGIGKSKYYQWRKRYGQVREHNGLVDRDFWLEDWERQAIRDFYLEHPQEGYRRLCYMMLDANVVAVSPSSVYRVLKQSGLLRKWNRKVSSQGNGFQQPLAAHEHWHVDISYLNIRGTFYYLCSILDGYSRWIVHGEIRESMREADVEIVLERAKAQYPQARPRIISDNGPQFVARDFKEFIRESGMTHVRTSPYYPQSNGKLERFHQTLKRDCIRPQVPLGLEQARQEVARFVDDYNQVRLHSALGYITPKDQLEGRAPLIWAERDRKLEAAREQRRQKRAKANQDVLGARRPLTLPSDPIGHVFSGIEAVVKGRPTGDLRSP